ncbi:MAG TPA: DNA-binding response regulator [Firmicutes bacterium]|nr:DNA-binding response regulator [Bacillota bacterium]HCX71121.1 DNA-binding response regulator [Bacillota bacterium]
MLKRRILVIDDETALVESICFNLEREGFQTFSAYNGIDGLEAIQTVKPDLIVLDLMLPGLDGLEICRRVRKSEDIPIIMLTAKESEVDRILGLELGADDYVTKPFSMRELMARVKSVLRRFQVAANGPDVLISGDVSLNKATREVTTRGTDVTLSVKEFDLLAMLMLNSGRVLTREILLDGVWGADFFGEPRTVDVHIRWLREKIEEDPANPKYIHTVRGVGYRFNPPTEQQS